MIQIVRSQSATGIPPLMFCTINIVVLIIIIIIIIIIIPCCTVISYLFSVSLQRELSSTKCLHDASIFHRGI